ncbi:hypothetical protein B0H10DRAFT_1813679, partial [Mycena sp. CBHHK59/15]
GYGTLDLCLVAPGSESSASESCRQLLEEIPTILPDTLDPHIPRLLARWKGFRVTLVSLAHFERNVFNISALFSIPAGNSSDKPYWVLVQTNPGLVAEFSCDGIVGVGLRGLWSAGDRVKSPKGENVKDRAEAWFEKVHEA